MTRTALLTLLLSLQLAGAQAQETVRLPAADRPLDPGFTEIFRVERPSGDPAAIVQVAFSAEGELYVFDRSSSSAAGITVYAEDGTVAREFGKMGWERGDFRGPAAFALLPDGRAVVQDTEHSAYMIFQADGSYERMVRYPRSSSGMFGDALAGIPAAAPTVAAGGGPYLLRAAPREAEGGMGAMDLSFSGSVSGPSGVLERIGLDGNRISVDTVVRGWRPTEGEDMSVEVSIDAAAAEDLDPNDPAGILSMLSIPEMDRPWMFAPPFEFRALPGGGLAYIDSVAYEVKVTDEEGRLQRVFTRPLDPTPVTEELQEEITSGLQRATEESIADMDDALADIGLDLPPGAVEGFMEVFEAMGLDEVLLPEFFPEIPVLFDLRVTWEGGLWVGRTGEPLAFFDEGDLDLDNVAMDGKTLGPIDVISPGGDYLGTLPAGTGLPDAFGPDGLAAWIEEAELMEPVVVVRRLPRAVRAP